ncbi:MAG: ATP-binding protein [Lachnospiraceae bacterium]|nr:ATP-binding protein [Lachnospiraceae bacterium]
MKYLDIVSVLIISRCEAYFKGLGIEAPFERFPSLTRFISEAEDGDLRLWAEAENMIEKGGLPGEGSGALRYAKLLELTGYDNVIRSLLDLCIADFSMPELGACISYHLGSPVTLQLACSLEGIPHPYEKDILQKAEKAQSFCYIDKKQYPLRYAGVSIDERVMTYLEGNDDLNPTLAGFTSLFDPGKARLQAPFISKQLIDRGFSFLSRGGCVLQLAGRGGRRFIARHIAYKLKKRFLFLNLPDLLHETKNEPDKAISALIREARFLNAGICFYGITGDYLLGAEASRSEEATRRSIEMLSRMLFSPLVKNGFPLILCTDLSRIITDDDKLTGSTMLLELPADPSYDERLSLWKGFKKLHKLSIDPELFAIRYKLNASETAKAVTGFMERGDIPKEEADLIFSKLIIQLTGASDRPVGRIIYADVLLDDVKIKPELRSRLNDMVTGVRESHRILDGCNLRRNYPYGRSVSLLLSGPPGTGKTMTANAIAGELKMPLYQVNLSSIVDKYVGETEKNLEKAFSYAEKTNTVLFFDEADSLFGKRSEVKDSHDKYANNEISYLLQRIEAYDGVVILATNIKGNIDPAFLRRIRYVVNFENPDENERRAIWEACFTDDIPTGEIDLDYLAAQFTDFTGSTIKTVFLNACSIASSGDEPLSMTHIIHSIKNELVKTSTISFTADTLGKYGYLAH